VLWFPHGPRYVRGNTAHTDERRPAAHWGLLPVSGLKPVEIGRTGFWNLPGENPKHTEIGTRGYEFRQPVWWEQGIVRYSFGLKLFPKCAISS
jgi:hypothetical protein